jgi:arsenical pump membrane protein
VATLANAELPPVDGWFWFCASVLGVTLCGLTALGLMRRPLSIAALLGAGVLLAGAIRSKRIGPRRILEGATPSLFVFVIGLLVVVRGVTPIVVRHVDGVTPGSPAWAAVVGAIGAGAGSNLINNVPVTLLSLAVSQHAVAVVRESMVYGVLVGANIGPTLTTYGSLATMLWLTVLRKRGLTVETGAYMRISLVTMPLVLMAALAGLLLVL